MAQKSYWERMRGLFSSKDRFEPVVLPSDKYELDVSKISVAAIKVLDTLRGAGYAAYLVGGSVRDLLLNVVPKDFDVVTDATPEEVHELFRNSRIIGRRFRLVHIRYKGELIEVSTFRAHQEPTHAGKLPFDGTPRHDNEFGSLEEDAWRRDFPINALYYDHQEQHILDFTGGVLDINSKLITVIGDPIQRFHEDPVRMLRAIRLAGKLDFTIDHKCEDAIFNLAGLLLQVPDARLFDEVLKLFFHGYSVPTYALLNSYGCFAQLFPDVAEVLQDDIFEWNARAFVEMALESTDMRIQKKLGINPGFLLAVLLWPVLMKKTMALSDDEARNRFVLRRLVSEVIVEQKKIIMLPKRFTHMMQEIWFLQYHLERLKPARVKRVMHQRHFRAAVDFLELRVAAGEEQLAEAAQWWRAFRSTDKEGQREMCKELRDANKKQSS